MLVSAVSYAQKGYTSERTHYLPARGYADPYSHSLSSGRRGVQQYMEPQYSKGYQAPCVRNADNAIKNILRGVIIAERIFTPYCSSEYYGYFDSHAPNRWVAGRIGMPFFPYHYMNNSPFYWYSTQCGNTVFYTSTNIMMGVTIDNQVQFIRDKNILYVWDTRGRIISRGELYAGYHSYLDMNTRFGISVVEVFFDGVCRINYLNIRGEVIESYELY